MKVTLIHAYSTTNSGDGLLVDEAAEIVREAHPEAVLTLVAIDPDSFEASRFAAVIHPLTGRSGGIGSLETLARGTVALLLGRRSEGYRRAVEDADLVVAVGGGYLRGKAPVEALKMVLAHVAQMPVGSDTVPFVYLPQSIGPLKVGTLPIVSRRLRKAAAVVVRDDRSVEELSALGNVHRAPDMALLGLPAEWDPESTVPAGRGGPIGLVARELTSSRARVRRYRERIDALAAAEGVELLAQATARGNNDPEFYESLGHRGPFRTLRDVVAPGAVSRPDVVVSVRLHGSIQTIRSGVPSVHLSYERKGFGAYADLGIDEFVHNVFDFDPAVVMAQVASLREDPSAYWAAVEASVSRLSAHRSELVDLLRAPERSLLRAPGR
ncbi:polysaccharide pyruvyl transferase family protein [Rathayibacter sp. VKM Ac-2927]|uniref:polysaccharide pyruvyl transferase family protein n=1 Tax=Rathayibacter sp. VKM Ac-2927 TaxID=2929478 RepID=UPI001FB277A1|nr:polysaccharide pyruvyl transferase family protein [Rathayibacter sp. VKM Ac-2927]MCJ1685663.1 polysaccharide pyruvyl transferase family protein [Rathayibacter sp. VKM Ac-2927]